MADIVELDQNKKPSVIPAMLAKALGLNVPDAPTPDLNPDQAGPPVPPELAQVAKPPQPDAPPPAIQGVVGAMHAPTPEPVPDPLAEVTKVPTGHDAAAQPQLAPPPKKTFMQKLKGALPGIINAAGVVGGGLEGGFGPIGSTPVGAEMFQGAKQAQAKAAAERYKVQNVDIPKAQAEAEMWRGANPTKQAVATTAAGAKTDVADTNAATKIQTTRMTQDGATQRELLKQGAPMNVDPELAQLAGQPELAGKSINGATLTNFVKTLNARGIGIKDLGKEGLWSVDKAGNRIKQVSVGSPSQMRGPENRFSDVFDSNGQLTTMNDAERAAGGIPKASSVMQLEGPTAADKNMAHMARTVPPHIADLRADLEAHPDAVGPVMGRLGTLEAGKWGSTGDPDKDYYINKVIGEISLLKSAVARTHFGGRTGPQAVAYFESLINNQKSVAGLNGVLDSVLPYMEGYSQMTNFTPAKAANSAPARNGSTPAVPPQSAVLPPQASAQLQEGHETTFGNGQVWTKRGGVPKRVK